MNRERIDRIPLNGTFELTARCNLKCKMCMIRIDNKRMAELGGRERTTNEWIHMASEIFEAGTLGLLLTGGEPMLRPDFAEIYKEIVRMGFMLTLYTNATLVTDEIMEVLREYPPHRIGITSYGASPETYEKVTGSANAYYKMLEGVSKLIQLPSETTIRTTIIKDNLCDLEKIIKWALGINNNIKFNVSRIVTKPVRGGIADVEACRLTPEENVGIIRYLNNETIIKPIISHINNNPTIVKESKKEKQTTDNKESKNETVESSAQEQAATLYGCDAGINSYTITWDGKLIGCQMLGDCETYPFKQGFIQAWNDFPDKVVLSPILEECRACSIPCTACVATRMAECDSLAVLPEYLCRNSKLENDMVNELVNEIKYVV